MGSGGLWRFLVVPGGPRWSLVVCGTSRLDQRTPGGPWWSLVVSGSPWFSLVVHGCFRWSVAQRAWTYGHLVVGVVVPLVIIAVANSLLLRRLRSFAGRRSTSVGRGTSLSHGTTATASGELPHRRGDAVDSGVRRQRASQNMARLVLAIVIIFVVCQLPYHIIEVFNDPCLSCLSVISITPTEIFRDVLQSVGNRSVAFIKVTFLRSSFWYVLVLL